MPAPSNKSIWELVKAENQTLTRFPTQANAGLGRSAGRSLPAVRLWSNLAQAANDSDDPQNAEDSEIVAILDVPDDCNGWAHLSAYMTGSGTPTVTTNPAGYLWGRLGPGHPWFRCWDRANNRTLATFNLTSPASHDNTLGTYTSDEYAYDIGFHGQLLFLPTVALAQTGLTITESGVRVRLSSF